MKIRPELSYLDPLEQAAMAYRLTHLDPERIEEQVKAVIAYIQSVAPPISNPERQGE